MKSYTDLEQSKKLAEILPLESADMGYNGVEYRDIRKIRYDNIATTMPNMDSIPCWSLAALLGVLPNDTNIVKDEADTENEKYMCTVGVKDDIICTFGNNPVDACVDMIIRLNELNLL